MAKAVLGFLLVALAAAPSVRVPQAHAAPAASASEFLQPTRLATAHLRLTAAEWRAMQPTGGFGGGGFGFGGSLLGPEGGRNGVAARQGIEFAYVHAALDLDGVSFPDVGVRYKGNGSYLRARGSDKNSLKIDLHKYDESQSFHGLTTLNFQNNITDISWMNEVLAYRLYRDAGSQAPRSTYVKVYITVEGQLAHHYAGLYSISENVDEAFTLDRFGTRSGAILKPSTQAPFTRMGDNWAAYNQTYDPKTHLTDAEQARIIEFATFVSSASDAEFAARIGAYVDLDAFARYFAVLVWIANADSMLQVGQNYYVYLHPDTHKFTFIAWDQDGSFGNFRNQTTGWSIFYPWTNANRFLERVYGVEAFRTQYLARMAEFSRTLFVPERFAAQMAEIVPVIRPAIVEEGAEWLPAFDERASGAAGLVPFARARAAFVQAELAKR